MKPPTATSRLSDTTVQLLPLFAPFRSNIILSADLIEEYLLLLLDYEPLRSRPLAEFYTMADELVDQGWWSKPNLDWEILAIHPILALTANQLFGAMREEEREAVNTCFIRYYTTTLAPKAFRPYLQATAASTQEIGLFVTQYETENLEAAIRMAAARGLLQAELYTSLDGYWNLKNLHDQRLRLSADLLDHFYDPLLQAEVLPMLLFHRAAAQKKLGQYAEAERTILEALALVPETDNSRAVLQQQLGNVLKDLGRHSEALPHFEAALAVYREVGDEEKIAEMYQNLGVVSRDEDDQERFQSLTEEAIGLYEKQGRGYFQAIGLQNLAAVWVAQHDYEKALATYRQALEIVAAYGDEATEALISRSIGVVYSKMDQLAEAKEWFQRALEIYLGSGAQDELAESWFDYGSLALKSGDLTDALTYYDQAIQAYQSPEGKGRALHMKAYIYSDYLQQPKDAIPVYKAALQAFAIPKKGKNWMETQYNFGVVLYNMEAYQQAVDSFKSVVQLFEVEDWPLDSTIAYSCHNLTLAYYHCDEREQGEEQLQRAKAMYKSLADEDSWLELKEEVEAIIKK